MYREIFTQCDIVKVTLFKKWRAWIEFEAQIVYINIKCKNIAYKATEGQILVSSEWDSNEGVTAEYPAN